VHADESPQQLAALFVSHGLGLSPTNVSAQA